MGRHANEIDSNSREERGCFGPNFSRFFSFRGIEELCVEHDVCVNILEKILCLQKSEKISFYGEKTRNAGDFAQMYTL